MPKLDPDEVEVICTDCNGFLFRDQAHNWTERQSHMRTVTCPYKCRSNGNGSTSMTVPEGAQKYGTS